MYAWSINNGSLHFEQATVCTRARFTTRARAGRTDVTTTVYARTPEQDTTDASKSTISCSHIE